MIDFNSIPESTEYSLTTLIGTGGLGSVYQGSKKGSEKPLAFKMVSNIDTDVPRFLIREYEILRDLDHPNIIHVYDLFRIGNQAIFAMEYFNALAIDKAFDAPVSSSPQKLEKTLFVVAQLVDALRYLHERQIVHCTIAPCNILVNEDFDVRLVDFEHARRLDEDESSLWPPGVMAGKPYYMAPEQILGNPVSPATDFYALGIVLYVILYGNHLFSSHSMSEIFQAKLTGKIAQSMLQEKGISEGISEVLAKLLHIDPAKRLTNHAQLVELLKRTFSEDSKGRTNEELALIHGSSHQQVISRRLTAETPVGLVKILFLAADPTDASHLRLGEELREIQEKLQLAKLREWFELHQRMSVRPADITQALLDIQPQIVHFSGHGTATGALCFENQVGETHPIQPDALAALFERFTNQVSCVVLNACYSEIQADAIAKSVDYVIGMNQAIGDKAAIAFAVGFYQALGAGCTIEEAYKLGCVQIQLQGIPEHLTPVLLKNERDPAEPQSVKLEIIPIERLENNCPHISVVVKNRENKTVFCKVESHGIYNSSGEDIKRSVSSYANHFSWAGGSDRGTKEIPPNLDGIINLAKVNERGYGIAFLFDENPHSYWETEGTYKLDLMIVGEFEDNSSRMEFVGQRVKVEFAYTKKETRSSSGEVVNNSELRLLTWRLIDTDSRLD